MGFNTAAIILNDQIHELAKDAMAGEHIYAAVTHAGRDDYCLAPGVSVLPSVHADTVQIVAIGGNRIWSLGYGHYRDDEAVLLRKLADQMGYRISRKPPPMA